ncbi:MAG TPA: FAD-binding and (Fe-S)-binding domain-containing protein [Actinomycetota bacterium]|nr:FAD-binding and (Fe-S)-binding domain-containing protein [Actinomycetota bacterium]
MTPSPWPSRGSRTRLEAEELGRALAAALPPGTVHFTAADRALFAHDASNFRQVPIGVVYPRTADDIVATHAVCREHRAPVLPRGCGTSLAGQATNEAVVIDCSRYMTRVLGVDPRGRTARAEPGAINHHVTRAASPYGLRFGPDPATNKYCTIGGNIGNNACGVHSLQARFVGDGSRTSDNVARLEVLTYDGVRLRVGPTSEEELDAAAAGGGRPGEIYAGLKALRQRYGPLIRARFPGLPRRVSGYNLDDLLPERGCNLAAALTGTEGTCVTVLEAELKLIPDVAHRSLLVVGYGGITEVARHLGAILDARPIGCECFDNRVVRGSPGLPPGSAWVLVELGGDTQAEADAQAGALARRLGADRHPPEGAMCASPDQAREVWAVREAGLARAAFPPGQPDGWPGWEDAAVPPERVGDYLADFLALEERHGLQGALYGHLGDGCIHTRISFDLATPGGVATYRAFLEEAADLVCSYGGSLSGEHGDGQQRAELLGRMFGEELVAAFREFKTIWDPDGGMNPGKVVDPYPLDSHLRLAGGPPKVALPLHFAYPDDGGSFAHATLRCVGVGRCRQPEGADVICPSYRATGDEQHSTRGRARLLHEMLRGEVVTGGWRSPEVKEALDLCLACKGCTSDCPVQVDMPTYKAEFLSHFWQGRLRPRHAYAFGHIDLLARAASRAPRAANRLARAPGLRRALQAVAGITPQRALPEFSGVPWQRWFAARPVVNPHGPRVVLWPDTFTNYFAAEVGIAAVEALEAAGWRVIVPPGPVCCGRPLYDYGFLDLARRYLHRCLDAVRDELDRGTPVVGLEPSCVATFRHELPRMLPGVPDAALLAERAQHFAGFLEDHGVALPTAGGDALLWGHCHQRATGGLGADQRLLEAMGFSVQPVTGGCCGLAGSWGYEAGHYDLSIACGEQALLPAVRQAPPGTVVVADGFSCRSQIAQAVPGRQAMHLAQVIAHAGRR